MPCLLSIFDDLSGCKYMESEEQKLFKEILYDKYICYDIVLILMPEEKYVYLTARFKIFVTIYDYGSLKIPETFFLNEYFNLYRYLQYGPLFIDFDVNLKLRYAPIETIPVYMANYIKELSFCELCEKHDFEIKYNGNTVLSKNKYEINVYDDTKSFNYLEKLVI